jgi:hypothetical protein
MKNVVRLSEGDVSRLIKLVINEQVDDSIDIHSKDGILVYTKEGDVNETSIPVTFEEAGQIVRENEIKNWKMRPITIGDKMKYDKSLQPEDDSIKFPQDYDTRDHKYYKGSTEYLLRNDDGKPVISVVGGNGAHGDGVNTFELWDFREFKPINNLTIEQVNQYVKDHPIDKILKPNPDSGIKADPMLNLKHGYLRT